jgi:hypothetical protein
MAKKYNRDIPLPSSNDMFGGPGDPKKMRAKADSLKAQSNVKKNRAELLANKAKKTTNVWPETRYTPEGREYMVAGKIPLTEKSNVKRASAQMDSMRAEGLYQFANKTEANQKRLKAKKKYTGLQEKVNIAKKLYKDNPSKVFSDAVKRAERNLADSVSASKPMYKKKR